MNNDDSNQRIVITGSSTITAAGIGVDPLVDALVNAKRHLKVRDGFVIAEIDDFDPKQYVRPRKALKVMCREIQTAYAASMLAAAESGIASSEGELVDGMDPHRLATVFGSEMLYHPSDLAEAAKVGIDAAVADESGDAINVVAFGRDGLRKITPLWLLKYLPNMPACHVGISLGALGPNNTLVTGDVSGVNALAEAISCIKRETADVAIVAAAGTRISETRFTYRCDTPTPTGDRSPDETGVPGDPDSTGVVLGEGSAAMVVETLASAQRRCVSASVEVLAVAQHFVPSLALSMPHRSAAIDTSITRGSHEAIELAIASVLKQADHPQIDFVVSHFSGDPLSDGQEAAAYRKFSSLETSEMIHPIAAVGHTGAASGLVGVAVAVQRLACSIVPEPTHGLAICHTTDGSATAVLLRKL